MKIYKYIKRKNMMEKMVPSNITRTDITIIQSRQTQTSRKFGNGLLIKILSSNSLATETYQLKQENTT